MADFKALFCVHSYKFTCKKYHIPSKKRFFIDIHPYTYRTKEIIALEIYNLNEVHKLFKNTI